jgi:hypothetical protein
LARTMAVVIRSVPAQCRISVRIIRCRRRTTEIDHDANAVLREDAGFHAYQMLEAGVRRRPVSCGPFTARTRGRP